MTKCHNVVKKCYKNVNLSDRKSQTSVKKSQNKDLGEKTSQYSVKETQKM